MKQSVNLAPIWIATSGYFPIGDEASVNYNPQVNFAVGAQDVGFGVDAVGGYALSIDGGPPAWVILSLVAAAHYGLSLVQSPVAQVMSVEVNAATLTTDFDIDADDYTSNMYILEPAQKRLTRQLYAAIASVIGEQNGVAGWCSQPLNRAQLKMSFRLYSVPVFCRWVADSYGPDGYDGPLFGGVTLSSYYTLDDWSYSGNAAPQS